MVFASAVSFLVNVPSGGGINIPCGIIGTSVFIASWFYNNKGKLTGIWGHATVAYGVGVSIVSTATIGDPLRLDRLRTVAMTDLSLSRPLWQLKAPDRIDLPAAHAFERILRAETGRPLS